MTRVSRTYAAVLVFVFFAALAFGQTPPRTSGTITANEGAVTLQLGVAGGTAVAAITGTWTATLNLEVSADCSTYVAQPRATVLSSGALGSTTTVNATLLIPAEGFQCVRVRANPFTSGTATVVIAASQASAVVSLGQALPTGSNTIGTVTANAGSGTFTVGDGAGALTVDGTVAATQSGTWTVQPGNTANTTAWKVDGSAVTQPVSGTVTANAGTNLNTSALALDATLTGRLPAGSSPAENESNTNTNLSRVGSFNFIFDGTAWDRWTGAVSQSGTWTVQPGNTANTTPWLVKFSQTTTDNDVDVAGTVTANQGTAAAVANAWPIKFTDGTNAITAGDNTNNAVRVNVVAGGGAGGGTSASDNSAFTGGTTAVTPIGALYDTTPPTITDGNIGAPRMNSSRQLQVDCVAGCSGSSFADNSAFTFGTTAISLAGGVLDDTATNAATENSAALARISSNRMQLFQLGDGAGNERRANVNASNQLAVSVDNTPTVTVGTFPDNEPVNVAQFGGSAVVTGTGASGAGIPRVTVASDSTIGQVASTPTTATLQSSATANGNGTTLSTNGHAFASLTVNCASCSGGTTINFEGSEDGTNFTAIWAVQAGTNTLATTTTAAGLTYWDVPVAGKQTVRARISAYSAGTITVTGRAIPVSPPATVVNANVVNTPTVTVGTFPDNEPINVAQMNGVAVTMGNGVAGTGVQRVTIASDSTYQPTIAALPNEGQQTAANSISVVQASDINICSDAAQTQDVVIETSADAQLVAASGSTVIYVCGYNFIAAGTVNVRLVNGTGSVCATGLTAETGTYQLTAQTGVSVPNGGGVQLKTDASDALCIDVSAAVTVSGVLTYVQR